MRVAFSNFIILSVLGVISINAAIVPDLRKATACCGCFGSCFHLFTIIGLTIIRFSADGQFCSTPEKTIISKEAGNQVSVVDFFNQKNGIQTINVANAFSDKNYKKQKTVNVANAFKERNYPGETLDVTKAFDEMNYSKGSKD